MKGKNRVFMRKNAGCLIVWLLILVSYFCGIKSHILTGNEHAVSVFLSAPCPDQKRAEEIIREEKKNDSTNDTLADVCFYRDAGFQTVMQKEYMRQTEVMVGEITGNAGNYDWRAEEFDEGDRNGCLIDEGTAQKLFGSTTPGGTLKLGDKEYEVRKVIPWKQSFMLIHPQNKEEDEKTKNRYNRLFIRKDSFETPEKTASRFLMKHSLSGKVVFYERIKGVALFVLLLLPSGIITGLLFQAFRERRKWKKGTAGFLLWTGVCVAAAVIFIWNLRSFISIPKDWIPGKWSDFGFWYDKLSTEAENFRLYLMLPKSVFQTEQLMSELKAVAYGGISFGLYCINSISLRKN